MTINTFSNSGTESKDEKITRLENEIREWKEVSKREGYYGVLLGGALAFIVGVIFGANL